MSWLNAGGVFGSFKQGNPAAPSGGKTLMLERVINLMVNPLAVRTHDGLASFQKSIFMFPGQSDLMDGLDGTQLPCWPMVEFIPLGPGKTGRSRILLPDDFVLLSYWASSSSNVKGGFRVSVYDVNARKALTIRPVNFNTIAGNGSAPLFLLRPYPFGRSVNGTPPQAKVTLVSLEAVNSNVQFGFFGIIAPGYKQP